jgi:membrane associated rhomboid family serine protease
MYAGTRRQTLLMFGLLVSFDFVIGGLEPQIDNVAHVGGLVAGVLVALCFSPKSSTRHNRTSIVGPG